MAILLLPGYAPANELRFDIGALSEDYFGRQESTGPIRFNGGALSVMGQLGRLDYGLALAIPQERPRDPLPFFDLSLPLGTDWRLGAGKVARHWSPSPHTSLILSRNGEAIPSLYLRKVAATRSQVAPLRWIGPWRGEVFLGRTDDSRAGEDALMIGMQLALAPTPNLEIELVRTVQLAGDGQPSGLGPITDALLGQTNEGAASGANQMAGLGLSYRLARAPGRPRLYAQVVGEDEAGGLPNCLITLAGLETEMALLGTRTEISLEAVDTRVDETENGFCGPNTAYNNDTYAYTNGGRVMGAAIDSEGRSAILRVRHERADWALHWSLGRYEINAASDPDHRLSTSRVTGTLASIGLGVEMFGGRLETVVVDQGFALDAANLSEGLHLGLGFSRQF
ncbi:MAG: capsule assembly Wzi family protein [Pseudomonadota bacterium]